MIDIVHAVQTIATGAALAYTSKLGEAFVEQSAKDTTTVLKNCLQKIKLWAIDCLGEKASLTKSLEKVISNPEDKKTQERLIEDLQDEQEENIQPLMLLIQELYRSIPENAPTILVNIGVKVEGAVTGGYIAGRDFHLHQYPVPEVKKNG